ncbi:hypothetical protein K5I04_04095, partial [Murdochiella sp. Marseille-P8839]|nr:hypothetical protein [Murdochiella sp. Marseille-P8839]
YFLQPGLGKQKGTLAMTFCFAQPGFRCKNQPWLANFLPASQGFTKKIDPGKGTTPHPARVMHSL